MGTRLSALAPARGRTAALDPQQTARLASFAGLTSVLEQQQAALTGGAVSLAAGAQARQPTSTALQALTWHQRFMDDTPAGRELRRNWQRQVILETQALEATRARYQKEQLSAWKRGQAAALPEARQLLLRWFGPLTVAIQKEQQRVLLGAKGIDRKVYGPYMLLLEPEQLGVLAMHRWVLRWGGGAPGGAPAMPPHGQQRRALPAGQLCSARCACAVCC